MRVRVDGLNELGKALAEMNAAAEANVLRKVGSEALQPIADAAQAMAPRLRGGLAASIAVGKKLSKRQNKMHRRLVRGDKSSAEVFVGPSYDLGAGGRHGHLQEFGTIHHAARPFMRPAWDAGQAQVLKDISTGLAAAVERQAARAAHKAATAARKAARLAARG
jgi:HK97 gp10 family phage protein